MRSGKGPLLMTGLVVLVGCSSLNHSDGYIKQPTVCVDNKWYGYHQGTGCPSTTKVVAPDASQEMAARLAAMERDRSRLASELAAARQHNEDHDRMAAEMESQFAALRQRNSDLEAQLADRDKELSGLRGDLSAEMAKLKQAERGLIRALKRQIDENNITVDLNNERLLINLASGYLFGSGEDQLKPAGADALKQVGSILKDFPEYKVHVEGHTDNRPILGSLKKKFPSNKELSEARATNAAQALADGGLSGAHSMGVADTKPVMPNVTTEGRAKNRRVEISVMK